MSTALACGLFPFAFFTTSATWEAHREFNKLNNFQSILGGTRDLFADCGYFKQLCNTAENEVAYKLCVYTVSSKTVKLLSQDYHIIILKKNI